MNLELCTFFVRHAKSRLGTYVGTLTVNEL